MLNLGDEPTWINADATRIEEVFINLLNNAAKYSDEGGRIEVHCELAPAGDYAQVRVRDNGVGIDKELLPRIFDLFTQAERSLARSVGGWASGCRWRSDWSICTAEPSRPTLLRRTARGSWK